MSALLLKADMCSAFDHVCFGPIADIQEFSSHQKKNVVATNLPAAVAKNSVLLAIGVIVALVAASVVASP
jgi:hypothetical protein